MVKAGKSLSVVVLALVLSLVAVAMTSTAEANPGELHVGPEQPYATIQEAIDAASDGDTITVHPGTYDGFTIENKSNISIIGQEGVTVNSANMFVEDGQELGLMASITKSTGIRIEDIIFDGEEIHVGMLLGIVYDDSTGSITDVTVRNMIGTEMAMGIGIIGSEEVPSAVDISGVTFENCQLGVWVESAEANFDRCSIKGMAPDGGYGIMARDNAWVTMENCVIYDCWKEDPQPGQAGFGIMVGMPEAPPPEAAAYMEGLGVVVDGEVSTVKIFGCSKIFNNNFGIYVDDDSDLMANGNNIEGNDIYGVYKKNPPSIDATNNWWGDASGPSGAGPGTGDAVSDNVEYSPWLKAEITPVVTGLDSIKENLVIAYGYKFGEGVGGWTVYNPEWAVTHPDWNSLTTLYVGRGYWINVSEGCDLTYGTKTYDLDAGWNLIGWLGW